MIRINAKKLVERQLSKYHYEKRMTKTEKINKLIKDMEFNVWMYNKHHKHLNKRFDKKCLNRNQWYLIENIENIKNKS